MQKGTVTSKGQTTIPKAIREEAGIKPGDEVVFWVRGGDVVVRRMTGSIRDLFGILWRPGQRPVSVEGMNEAIAQAACESGMAGLEAPRKTAKRRRK
jgi:AbrB family looped-hinge helix DNA binding protein